MKRTLLLVAAIALMLAILHTFGLTTNNYAIITFSVLFIFQANVIIAIVGKPKNSNLIVLAGLLALLLIAVFSAYLVLMFIGTSGGIIMKAGIVAMFTASPLTFTFLYLGQYRRE